MSRSYIVSDVLADFAFDAFGDEPSDRVYFNNFVHEILELRHDELLCDDY